MNPIFEGDLLFVKQNYLPLQNDVNTMIRFKIILNYR